MHITNESGAWCWCLVIGLALFSGEPSLLDVIKDWIARH